MSADLFGFFWACPKDPGDGFRWDDMRVFDAPPPAGRPDKDTQRVLVVSPSFTPKVYEPLTDTPALFRVFAEVEAREDSIQAFANEYGTLRKDEFAIPQGPPGVSQAISSVVLYRDWCKAIRKMSHALEVWEMCESDAPALSRRFEYRKDGIWHYTQNPDGEGDLDKGDRHRIDLSPELNDPTNPMIAAKIFLQRLINGELAGNSSSLLLFNPEEGKQVIQITPHNLLAAMWLQFARAIAGDKSYRRCKECGGWFEISGDKGGKTMRRLFCSDKCRVRDHREKQERAVKLAGSGKSAKEIANELNSDVSTVKSWLKKKG